MKSIAIEIHAECTGADLKETINFQIQGEEPNEKELKEIEELAKTEAIDGLGFSYTWEIKQP